MKRSTFVRALRHFVAALFGLLLLSSVTRSGEHPSSSRPRQATAPAPLLRKGHSVDWWFVFKLNSGVFPGCDGAERQCIFGGNVQTNQKYSFFGQQFVYSSSENESLQKGSECAGDSTGVLANAGFPWCDRTSHFPRAFVFLGLTFFGFMVLLLNVPGVRYSANA